MKDSRFISLPLFLLLIGSALFFVVVAVFFPQSGGNNTQRSLSGSYSPSAIGFGGLYDLLKRLDMPVTRNRGVFKTAEGKNRTVLLLAPDFSLLTDKEIEELRRLPRTLLVPAKWRGQPTSSLLRWVKDVEPLPKTSLQKDILSLYPRERMSFQESKTPIKWTTNEVGYTPFIKGASVRLLEHHAAIRPLVASKEGVLVGEIKREDGHLWIVSDPDIASNHGLIQGDNALFMVALLNRIRFTGNSDTSADIVFDETVHGIRAEGKNELKELFQPPFLVVSILVVLSASVWVFSGIVRFGGPLVSDGALHLGKEKLLENSARLLEVSGHQGAVTKRYVRMVIRDAGARVSLKKNEELRVLAEALDKLAMERGVARSCVRILEQSEGLDERKKKNLPLLEQCARDIYFWKVAFFNESRTNRKNH